MGLMQIGLQLELVEITRCTILSLAARIPNGILPWSTLRFSSTALSGEDSDSNPKRSREDPDNDLILFLADGRGKKKRFSGFAYHHQPDGDLDKPSL